MSTLPLVKILEAILQHDIFCNGDIPLYYNIVHVCVLP